MGIRYETLTLDQPLGTGLRPVVHHFHSLVGLREREDSPVQHIDVDSPRASPLLHFFGSLPVK